MVTEYLIYDEVESRLRVEKRDFEEYVSRNKGVWSNSCYFVENKIDLIPAKGLATPKEAFKDTLVFDKYSNKEIRFRQLSFYTKLGNDYFQVQLRKSLLESETLLKYLTITILALLAVAFGCMYFIQKKISENIWHPFYDTLNKLKSFDLNKNKDLELISSNILEFEDLNLVLEKMSQKMKQDYRNLKEFTENASHEIQTPLALINARVEELIQSKHLTEKDLQLINEIQTSTTRVSKLGNTLLLLSKIENRQFVEAEKINFDSLIKNKLDEFEEIFSHHNLKVTYHCDAIFYWNMNSLLADNLVTNLIGNAVKHNVQDGIIEFTMNKRGFEISNTGQPLAVDPATLFQRFKKGKQRNDSSGLGLAIVKEICSYYQLQVSYTYKEGRHSIAVKS